MTADGTSAPRELGWRGPILALLALTILPITPLRVVTPIEQSVVLLVPALAACALVAWWNGGRAGLALVWVALAAWTLSRPTAGASANFDVLARGWSLIVAACFGLVCCLGGARSFFVRALTAVTVALGIGFAIVAVTRSTSVIDVVRTELTGRSSQASAGFETALRASPRWSE